MRLALAQINTTVGNIRQNMEKILSYIARAESSGADVVIFPEMSLTGYPPEDLLFKPGFIRAAEDALGLIARACTGVTAVIGTAALDGYLRNSAAILDSGRVKAYYHKQHLPNYGVFDENRYFAPGNRKIVFGRNGYILGVSICEDIWYPDGPHYAQVSVGGANLLVNISASPYFIGKGLYRERMLSTRASDSTAYVVYCNLVGGQDELVFDGHSLVCAPDGEIIARGRQFEEDFIVFEPDAGRYVQARLKDPRMRSLEGTQCHDFEVVQLSGEEGTHKTGIPVAGMPEPLSGPAEVYKALVMGCRDYVRKNGFKKVVVGLSGGVDSSLVAAIAADALGNGNVVGIGMPTRYSSTHSLSDAETLAGNLGVEFRIIPIDTIFQAYLNILEPVFRDRPEDVTEENLQPRIRGTILMALSNKFGWLVLTTGNKSETAVGYSTLYGDTAGGFAVIKDVPKTLVYELCRYRNAQAGFDIIPDNVLAKAPSAELKPDQKDSDSLPEYADLDPILEAYVESFADADTLPGRGFNPETVRRVVRMVDGNEYKRRQSPPGIKITSRAFGKDWRLPITNGFNSCSF